MADQKGSSGGSAPPPRAQGQPAAPEGPQITVTVGQIGQKTKEIKVPQGTTIGKILRDNKITLGKKSVIIRGVAVKEDYVPSDRDTIVVTGNAKGGIG